MEQFGKYQLIRRIGTGGMAEVFLARTSVAQGLNKKLVIKKIHPAFARSRQFVAMFVDEAQIALGLNHPNIVQVFDFGQLGETYFLAMEYVEGLDLLRAAAGGRRGGASSIPFGPVRLHRAAGGQGPRLRPPQDRRVRRAARHRPPRHLAAERPAVVGRRGEDRRLRHRPRPRRPRGRGRGQGQVRVHVARAGARRAGRPPRRRLLGRHRAVRAGLRAPAVSAARARRCSRWSRRGAIPRPRDVNRDIPPDARGDHPQGARVPPRRPLPDRPRPAERARPVPVRAGARDSASCSTPASLAQFISPTRCKPARPAARPQRPPSSPPAARARRTWRAAPMRSGGGASRRHRRRPPEQRSSRTPAAASSAPATAAMPAAEPTREARERKHVLVLEGQSAARQALERRLGRREALRLLEEFLKVARDVAFKHDAYVHRDRRVGPDPGRRAAGRQRGRLVARDPARARARRRARRHRLDVEPELRLALGIQRGVALVRRSQPGRASATSCRPRPPASRAGWPARRRAATSCRRRGLRGCPARLELRGAGHHRSAAGRRRARPTRHRLAGSQRARVYRLRGPKERAQRLRERERGCRRPAGRPRARAQGAARRVPRRAGHRRQAPGRDRRRRRRRQARARRRVPRHHPAGRGAWCCTPRRASPPR